LLKEYLKDNVLVTDGAMGTYYALIAGSDTGFPEFANVVEPDTVLQIHREYIDAGAKLIRTNTFSVNTASLDISREEAKELLIKGYEIARKAAQGKNVFVAADIGPIPEVNDNQREWNKEEINNEYQFIIQTFLDVGAEIFIFETFSSTDYLKEITSFVKAQKKDAFVITQFALMPDGYTRKGISINRIVREVKEITAIDAFGFNCGTGPKHLYNNIKNLDIAGSIISVLPNAGFPEIINERTVYVQNPEYFSDMMMEIKNAGVKIIGGCCGTTPLHIKKIAEKLISAVGQGKIDFPAQREKLAPKVGKTKAGLFGKLEKSNYMVAVELAPPFNCDMEKVINSARILKETGMVDLVTVPDSPLGKIRLNSIIAAARIKRDTGLDAMPHICCRDRNIIALKSDLLGAYIEGIRNILVVTGDPIPSSERSEIKSVFDLNSFKLIKILREMNQEHFAADPIKIAGALNLNVNRKDVQENRMRQKIVSGASFFLTQPIFEEETIAYLAGMKKPQGIKILAGIMPMVSLRNAQFLNNEIPGIRVPEKYINSFTEDMSREEAEQTGIEISLEILEQIKDDVDGFYFITPFNRVNIIVNILKKIFLQGK
jgi:methionine synthase I (cobalamin-dependent)/5,10-methylenetetrahydrofolate reductase